jgi:FkbM family methyltransferase
MTATPTPLDTLRLHPITLLDVGARGGLDPRWRRFADLLSVTGFELDPDECAKLNAGRDGVTYYPYALGERDEEQVTLHVTKNPQASSVLRPNAAFVAPFAYAPNMRVAAEARIALTSLETVCARHELQPEALKLDVQGLELAVLRGAGYALDRVLLVESEVEFNPLYEHQPLFGEIDEYLRQQGFFLLGLRRTFWRRTHPELKARQASGGTLVHGDGLWVRPDAIATPRQFVAFCVMLAAYRQSDWLNTLLLEPHTLTAHWPENTRRWLLGYLDAKPTHGRLGRALSMTVGPLLRGWHHRDARAWADNLRRAGGDWHDPTFY